jgi:hypothetical protein
LTNFDSASVDARAGVFLNKGDDNFKLGFTLGKYTLAETAYRNANGLTGDWRHNFNQNNQLNVFAQYNRNRFAQSDMQINDFIQTVYGTGFLHILPDGKTALFGSMNVSSEHATYDRADGDKTGFGLRAGGQTAIYEKIDAYANVGYQTGRYNKENSAFLDTRNDKLVDVTLGGNWHFEKLWTMRPQISYSRNNSNIQIYAFDRIDASITVRRDF